MGTDGEENIALDYKERGWQGLGWTDLAQYQDRWLVVAVQCRECLGSV